MAAVTFSGFNNIDFNQVVSAIMAQERQPLSGLERHQSTLQSQNTAFGTLATRLSAVQSALSNLSDGSGVTSLKAVSTDSSVGVATTGGAIEGQYDVVISSLAHRQVTASVSTYASADAVVATGGALTLTGADGTSAIIPVNAVMTVKELVDAINSAQNAPVTASLVQSTPGSYQIVLTGRHTGAANAFVVGSTLSGGEGVTFADADGNGLAGDSPTDNVRSASDASITVNGLAVTSSSNTVSDVVPGVTVTLTAADPAKTVTVTVSRDVEASKAGVQALATAYNDLVGFINDQRTAASNGEASIARDPLVQQLKNAVRATLLGAHANGGTYTRLAEVGVGFDRFGKMVIDDKTFDAAVTSRPLDVQALFAGDDGVSGAFGAFGSLIKGYTQSGGLVSDVRSRLSTQMRSIATRIDAFEAQLEVRRFALQKEFQAADEAMSLLNAQVASLAALGNQFRLF